MKKNKFFKNVLKHGGSISLVTSIIVLVAFAVGVIVGTLAVTKFYGVKNISSIVTPMTGGFADGWKAARAKLAETNPMMNNTSSLSGQVKEVKGKEISFTAGLINPLDDESLKTRTVIVGDDTKITVYKLKNTEQLTKDREEAQASLASLQKENNSINTELSECNKASMNGATPATMTNESDSCKQAREKFNKNMQAMNEAQQKMDMYQKVDGAKLSDIQSGWNITVMAEVVKKGEDKDPAMMSQYVNISSAQKFTASSIDVREVNVMSAGGPAI